MRVDDLIETMPEEEQKKLFQKLAKKFKNRESARVPREVKVATMGKILAMMNGMNLSEMKTILNFSLATVEAAMDQWKNPGRDGRTEK